MALERVVVTSPLNRAGEGFTIQDQGGGPWSGIYIYIQGGLGSLYLGVGDEINVTGVISEYYDFTELVVASPEHIEVTGEAEVIVDRVDPTAVSDWEQWESCLIGIGESTVLEVNSYGEALLDNGLTIDDDYFFYELTSGVTLEDVIGPVGFSNYDYVPEWKILPRDENDLVGYKAGGTRTIAELQRDGVTGTVTVEGVVATSGPTDDGDGFFVQDAGGGPWSGIYVFAYDGVSSLGVSPGDTFDIRGSVSEYYGWTELVVSDLADITPQATGPVTTDGVDPASVDDWEKWESCLVDLGPTEVVEIDGYGAAWLDAGVSLDSLFLYPVVNVGDAFDPTVGLIGYSFDAFRINPREDADLGGYGGGHAGTVTIGDVQSGAVAEGSTVTLEGVIATSGANSYGTGFFVQDDGGGPWSGVFVFVDTKEGTDGLGIAEGDVLDITGVIDEYYDATNIVVGDAADITTLAGPGSPLTSDLVDADSVTDWEQWEGCLITTEDEVVADDGDLAKYGEVLLESGLEVNDLFFDYTAGVSTGTSWSSVTGPIDYSFSSWTINPRSSADLVD